MGMAKNTSSAKVSEKTSHSHRHHHASHAQATVRLNRASGHLRTVVGMIEDEKPCSDILQQLSAVISALNGCRIVLLQDHLETCLKKALKPTDQHLVEEIGVVLKQAFKNA